MLSANPTKSSSTPTRILPAGRRPPLTDPTAQKILIYGPPKIGKSTWAASIPDAVILATERGVDNLECAVADCTTLENFRAACVELKAGGHPYKTVVIDTVDNLYLMLKSEECRKRGIVDPGQAKDHGAVWGILADHMRNTMIFLQSLGLGIVLIAHSREVDVFDAELGSTERKTAPSLTGSVRDFALGFVDHLMFATVGPNKARVLRTAPSRAYEAGSRMPGIPDPIALSYPEFLKHVGARKS